MLYNYKKQFFLLQVLAILTMPLSLRSQECEKMKISDFPKKDLPADVDLEHIKRTDIKDDESNKYYYGIGVPVDYVKARRLAFMEMAALGGQEDPIEGSSILMMLYANGFGVERNLDISIRLACANVGGSGAEVEGRLQHLRDMKSGASTGVFDVCDDATSGYLSNFCASIHSEIADIARNSSIDSIIRKWPEPRRAAYERLRRAASSFFYERVFSEVDQSGTARVAMQDEESASLEDGFKEDILHVDSCGFSSFSAREFMEADQKLNRIYSKIMADKQFHHGTVTQAGIRSAQRKWIAYRDAWVVFGAVVCPQVTGVSLKTMIREERIGELEDFVEE